MPGFPTVPNEIWSLDFVHDSCLNGTKLKVLAVIDEFTRERLALEAAASIKSATVQKFLAGLFKEWGAPKSLRSDNGPEFIAHSLYVWLSLRGTRSRFIKPGAPWMNGKVESFNSSLRAEFLNAEVFHNLADAQIKLSLFRNFYNIERKHSALKGQTPASFSRHHKTELRRDSTFSNEREKGSLHKEQLMRFLLGPLLFYLTQFRFPTLLAKWANKLLLIPGSPLPWKDHLNKNLDRQE